MWVGGLNLEMGLQERSRFGWWLWVTPASICKDGGRTLNFRPFHEWPDGPSQSMGLDSSNSDGGSDGNNNYVYLVLLCFTDNGLFGWLILVFRFLQVEGLWQPSVEQVCWCHVPTAFAPFVSLCPILVILVIFQPYSLLSCVLWWSVSSDYDPLKAHICCLAFFSKKAFFN